MRRRSARRPLRAADRGVPAATAAYAAGMDVSQLVERWRADLPEHARWMLKLGVESAWLARVAEHRRVALAVSVALAGSEDLIERKLGLELLGFVDAPPGALTGLLAVEEKRAEDGRHLEACSAVESIVSAATRWLRREARVEEARAVLDAIAKSPRWNVANVAADALSGGGLVITVDWPHARDELDLSRRDEEAFDRWLARAAYLESPPAAPAVDPRAWAAGTTVTHAKLGRGVVVRVDLSAGEPRVTVRFEDGRERTILQRALSPS